MATTTTEPQIVGLCAVSLDHARPCLVAAVMSGIACLLTCFRSGPALKEPLQLRILSIFRIVQHQFHQDGKYSRNSFCRDYPTHLLNPAQARNQEKAQSMLYRFRQAQAIEMGIERPSSDRRPRMASSVSSLKDCEKWRGEIMRDISRKVSKIQDGQYLRLGSS